MDLFENNKNGGNALSKSRDRLSDCTCYLIILQRLSHVSYVYSMSA